MTYQLFRADCRRSIPLADASVQCVVTSPPYWGLRDYGVSRQIGLEPTPEEYVQTMVAIFREVRRVLRANGTCWLNLGDSYNSAASNQNGFGLDGKVRGGNIERGRNCRIDAGLKPKDLVGIPWRVALALQADGWYLRSDIIWAKLNPMPESVTDRPTKSHEYLFLLSKSERYYWDGEAVKEPMTGCQPPGNRRPYDPRRPDRMAMRGNRREEHEAQTGRNIRTVWTIATEAFPGSHFATFPRALVEPCILAGCPSGGIVFDPFAGSGTVCVVALAHKRRFIGCDLSREYLAMAQRRIDRPHAPIRAERAESLPLFGDV